MAFSFLKKFLPNFKSKKTENKPNKLMEDALRLGRLTKSYNIIPMPLPNSKSGWPSPADIAIIHYSAGYSVQGCYNALLSRRLSVHESVERDGKIYQHVSHDNRGIHAGHGRWGGRGNMNGRSLGVEVINFGWGFEGDGLPSKHSSYGPSDEELLQDPNSRWHRIESHTKNGEKIFTRVITGQAMSKFPEHRAYYKGKLWAEFTPEQIDATHWLVWEWMKQHPNIILENVIGHEHVTPHRKTDPGPAWPWRETERYLESRAASERPELLDPGFKSKERIKAVQSHIHRCGISVGSIDGIWGSKTAKGAATMIDYFNSIYKLELAPSDIREDNCLKLANAFRLIPGFNPGHGSGNLPVNLHSQ